MTNDRDDARLDGLRVNERRVVEVRQLPSPRRGRTHDVYARTECCDGALVELVCPGEKAALHALADARERITALEAALNDIAEYPEPIGDDACRPVVNVVRKLQEIALRVVRHDR